MTIDETEAIQNADFLSIALEEFDVNSPEVGRDFVIDVHENLVEAGEDELANHLEESLSAMENGNIAESREGIEFVLEELLHRY